MNKLTVSAVAAKSHFSQLLNQVMAGEEITITRHGEPVARLVPLRPATLPARTAQVIAEIRNTRQGTRLAGLSIKELITEGRKY